jgi:hypothetical protein
MILARVLQTARHRERSRRRIEDLKARERLRCVPSAGDQHAAVGEQRGGVMAAGGIQWRQRNEGTLRRIIEFRRGQRVS